MITPKQYRLFIFIQTTQPCPSYEEMAEFMGVKSIAGPYAMVSRMVRDGLLERTPGINRSVKVVVE